MNTDTYRETKEFKSEVSQLGFYVAMISWTMLFAALFLSYALFRFRETTWPPIGFESVSLFWPSMSTGLIALSSLFYYLYELSFKNKETNPARIYYVLSLGLGFSFLASQKILWNHLESTGIYAGSGIFASIVYGFTWIHAGHVFIGVLGLVYAASTFIGNRFGSERFTIRIQNIGKFWHFLGVIWLLMFTSLFLI